MRPAPTPPPTCTVLWGPRSPRTLTAFSHLTDITTFGEGSQHIIVAIGKYVNQPFVAHWPVGAVAFEDILRNPYEYFMEHDDTIPVEIHLTQLLPLDATVIHLSVHSDDDYVGFAAPYMQRVADTATTIVAFHTDAVKHIILARPRTPRIVVSVGPSAYMAAPRTRESIRTNVVLSIAECYRMLTGADAHECVRAARTVLIAVVDECAAESILTAVRNIEYQEVYVEAPLSDPQHAARMHQEMEGRAAIYGVPHAVESTFSAFKDAAARLAEEVDT